MVDEISLGPPQQAPQTVSLGGTAPPSEPWVSNRAFQLEYGLGPILGQDAEAMTPTLRQGKESQLRQQAASTIDLQSKQDWLDKLRAQPNITGTFLETQPIPTNPAYVVESGYAQKYMSNLYDPSVGHTLIDDAQREIPEQVAETKLFSEEYATKSRKIANKYQDALEKYQGQSYGGWLVNMAKSAVPFYSQLKTTGKIGLWGSNLEDVAMSYLRMPMSEFTEKFDRDIDKLIKDNPGAALELLQATYGLSHSDKVYYDIMGGIDVTTIPGIPALARKVLLYNGLRSASRDMLIAQGFKEPPAVAAARGAGDVKGAAIAKASEAIQAELKGRDPVLQKALDTLPSYLKTAMDDMRANWGNTSRELLTRTLDSYQAAGPKMMELIMNSVRSERVPIARATTEQLEKLTQLMKDAYPQYKDGQLDMSGPHQDPLTKSWHYALHMGTTKGELFKDAKQAKNTGLHRTGNRDVEVIQEGKQFKYMIRLPIRETDADVRQLFLDVPQAVPVHNWLNAFIGIIRSPADTLAHDQMLNRVAASYGPNNFFKLFRKQVSEIQDLQGFIKRKRFKDFEDFVSSATQELDDQGRLGKSYKGAADINEWYLRNKRRTADDSEISAYFAFKKGVEMDWILRQVMVNVNKSRVGAKNHRILHASKEGNIVYSPYFDGTELRPGVDDFPTELNASVLVLGDKGKHVVDRASPSLANRLAEGYTKGTVRVVRIYDTYNKPLSAYARSNAPIKYVITDKSHIETRELQWDSLPHREGGHFSYEDNYDWYTKEPMFEQDPATKYWHYTGDRTLAANKTKAEAEEFGKHLMGIRKLIKEGEAEMGPHLPGASKLDRARELHYNTIKDESWEDHLAGYHEQTAEGKYKPSKMDVNAKVYAVPSNRTIADIDSNLLKDPKFEGRVIDGTRGYSDANISKVQFTSERDVQELRAVDNVGTKHNPVFKFTPAQKVDPLPMMNRAWTRLINNFFIDDVKMSAIESWVAQARPYLKDHLAAQADNAYRTYMEANAGSFKDTKPDIVRQMMFNKQKIDQFIGTASKMDTFLWHGAQTLADSIYKKAGPKWAIVPTKMLPYIKEPFRAMRSLVFNEKVGLFSMPQFMVHLTTYSTVLGVAGPAKAIPGTFAAFLHLWSLFNPHIIDELDRFASTGIIKYGRPGELKEAMLLGRTTGFFRAEHEHAMLDSSFKNQIVKSGFNKFLDWGQVFFKGGLGSVRAAAWYTAYKEFRTSAGPWSKIHPDTSATRVISNIDRLEILKRANTLAHNMDRSHSNLLNQGALSMATQFYTYQQRLIEMMFPFFGKQLTTKEKTRLFATNLLLFGFPIAASLTPAGILPVSEYIRQKGAENGYVVGDNFASSMFMGGALDQLGALVSGGGDWRKGEHYNWGGRYGTKGLEWVANSMREDQHIWEWALGASYQTGMNTLIESDGFFRAMLSGIKTIAGIPQPEGTVYPMTIDVLIRPFREISAVNTWDRFLETINTGNWWSKQGRLMEKDVSVGEALWMSMSGLQRQSTEDIFTYAQARKSEKEYMDHTRKLFFTAMSGYYTSMYNKDPDQAKQYFQQGQQILISRGYPVEQLVKVYHEAANGNNKALADKLPSDYFLTDVPMGRREGAEQARRAMEEINKLKGRQP